MYKNIFFCIFIIGLTQGEVYIHKPKVGLHYKFYKNPQTWFQARVTCKNDNAELAMPKNENETAALLEIFENYPKNILAGIRYPDYILLGFHDIFNEGEYITFKGETIQYYYHKWAEKQPDNSHNEDCGSLHRNGGLNDFPCGVPGAFVCQKREEQSIASFDSFCEPKDSAYHYVGGLNKYYKLHLDPRNWADARTICQAEDAHLAIIRSKKEAEYLSSLFNDPKNHIHYVPHRDYALIGFHDSFNEGQYITVLDEDINDIGYSKWSPGQPDNANKNENCGSMYQTGELNDFPCNVPAVFFCEKSAGGGLDVRFSPTK